MPEIREGRTDERCCTGGRRCWRRGRLRHHHGQDHRHRLCTRTPLGWWAGCSCRRWAWSGCWTVAATYLFYRGVGIWGINVPVAWGFAIINFVWWIGIGHAGTLISAILLLLKQTWRNSINRFAEAMTLFAVHVRGHVPAAAPGPSLAGVLAVSVPQHHDGVAAVPQPAGVGRVRGFDVLHDFAAVLVRRTGSGPGDHARQRASTGGRKIIYGMLALGWRGSARHWKRYESAYLYLAGWRRRWCFRCTRW